MPLRDGTGPLGFGPGSGRGRGGCYAGFGYRSMSRTIFHGRPGWLLGIVAPLVSVVLRDLLNPSGVLRRIAHASLDKRIADGSKKSIREAECTIMNTQPVPIVPQRKLPGEVSGDIAAVQERKKIHENSNRQR